jgi:hypothetical protein
MLTGQWSLPMMVEWMAAPVTRLARAGEVVP